MMRLGIIDLLVAGFNFPFTPRRNDRHVRRESLNCKLKANLIVALARTAMTNRIGALRFGYLHNAFGDDRTRKGRAEHIPLVLCAGLDGRKNILVDKFLRQILDIQLGSAGFSPFPPAPQARPPALRFLKQR